MHTYLHCESAAHRIQVCKSAPHKRRVISAVAPLRREIFVEGAGVLGGKLNRGMCNIIFKRANWEKDADTGELMQNDANPDEVRARHTHTRARARAHAHAPVAAIDRQSAQHAALARSRPPSPQSPAAGWALERSPSPLPRYHSYPNPPRMPG